MEGSVKVVGKKQKIPSASDVRKEAMRQEKSVLRRVQAASTGSGANQPANVIQAGNDTSTATVFKFFPRQGDGEGGRHRDAAHAAADGRGAHVLVRADRHGAGTRVPAADRGGRLPAGAGRASWSTRASCAQSEPPGSIPTHTGATQHGNGFFSTGALDADRASPAIPSSLQVRFTTPGTYPYICLIHPFMVGSVTVTA